MSTASYVVTGMTCGHCASSVREEVEEIAGVRDVEVDHQTGALTITSDAELDREAVAAAVTEAGYQLS